MTEKQARKNRRKDGAAVQVFIDKLAYRRFRAACALNDSDVSETMERLMIEYTDKAGLPAHLGESGAWPVLPASPPAAGKQRKK